MRLVIRPGATVGAAGQVLQDKGLIRSALVFRLFVRQNDPGAEIRPGRYVLSADMGMDRLLAELKHGQPQNNSFTLPEGLTLSSIAQVLADKGFASSVADFVAVADQSHLADAYLPAAAPLHHRLEGYLFPDTYQVDPQITDQALLKLLFQRAERALTPQYRQKAAAMGLTPHQFLTLASIVEAEARLDSERPIIAAVYLNRLKLDMRLDADPTVRYFLDKPPGLPLTEADLGQESPYNTYLHRGLPPGPIGNPGEASLRAVLNPADVPYLYFVAKSDGSGAHVFSKTLEEHNAAVAAQSR